MQNGTPLSQPQDTDPEWIADNPRVIFQAQLVGYIEERISGSPRSISDKIEVLYCTSASTYSMVGRKGKRGWSTGEASLLGLLGREFIGIWTCHTHYSPCFAMRIILSRDLVNDVLWRE